jgi:hypothetical protein
MYDMRRHFIQVIRNIDEVCLSSADDINFSTTPNGDLHGASQALIAELIYT